GFDDVRDKSTRFPAFASGSGSPTFGQQTWSPDKAYVSRPARLASVHFDGPGWRKRSSFGLEASAMASKSRRPLSVRTPTAASSTVHASRLGGITTCSAGSSIRTVLDIADDGRSSFGAAVAL